jgi:DNA adenine methylase
MGNAKDTLQALGLDGKSYEQDNYELYPPLSERLRDYKRNPKKAAFGWVGGKSLLANAIIAEFPEHQVFVEVFAGALNILYRKERSKVEVANDIYGELINLHLTIKRRPQALSFYLNEMLISRHIFTMLCKKQLTPRNDTERAAFYYYRTTQSYCSMGEYFAMPKRNRAPKNIYKSFKVWHNRLKGVCIENMDFQKLIENYDTPDTLFYLDPPYVGTENYYEGSKSGGFTMSEHERLYNALKGIQGKFVLSYNDCEVARHLYRDYNIKELKTTYGLHAKERIQATELLIKNF